MPELTRDSMLMYVQERGTEEQIIQAHEAYAEGDFMRLWDLYSASCNNPQLAPLVVGGPDVANMPTIRSSFMERAGRRVHVVTIYNEANHALI